ncbi:MAG TPA: hypothetical protein VHM94_11395 [Acidimicrobiia bacterium]|nr:hypothetical protein [Acidimicrobiia bacterium]
MSPAADPVTRRSLRPALGVVAIVLVVGGLAFFVWPGLPLVSQVSGGLIARSGAMLGAIWFAWPVLTSVRPWVAAVLVVVLGVAVVRPSLLLVVIPLVLVVGYLGGRSR